MKILGIETSCDETAAAIVTDTKDILSHVVYSQTEQHLIHRGVVPEIAARAHLEILPSIIDRVMTEANLTFCELDGIAATAGPGLIGGVMMGVMAAKTIAAIHNIPFLAVNHLVAHALTVRLTHCIEFPYLLLLVSGGHTQLLVAHNTDDFQLLGETMDDAVGEAFDKTARLLDLPYPGGPAIEALAKKGTPERFSFPRPLLHKKDPSLSCAFSLSGLKTAVRQLVHSLEKPTLQDFADIAASFQAAIGDILCNRVENALNLCATQIPSIKNFVLAGGVASNLFLRERLQSTTDRYKVDLIAPPLSLCTDNGAMVAWAGVEKLKLCQKDGLDFAPRPRWNIYKNDAGEK